MNFNVSNCSNSLMFTCQRDSDSDFETKSSRFSANERMGAKGVVHRLMACDFKVFRMGFDIGFRI